MSSLPQWHDRLAPGQTRDQHGALELGGVSAEQLAKRYGTPSLVINLDVVDAAIDAFQCSGSPDLEVSYAAKAFLTIGFARHLIDHPIGLDVCSMGELATAERAGFPRARMTLHGAGKSDDELMAACAGRVGSIVVDGVEELQRLVELGHEGCRAEVLLRLNVGIEAETHASVRTGGDGTKFGIHRRDEGAAVAALRAAAHLRFTGLHAHIGSQIAESAAYVDCTVALVDAATRFARAGLDTERLVIGGGFSVQSHPDVRLESIDLNATISAARTRLAEECRERGLPLPRLGVEPGRAIVALAGSTLYRVLAVKRQALRTFVIVDGGVAENPRPALYGARHLIVPVDGMREDDCEVTLCGRSCENDELGVALLPSTIGRGDLLAMCATGAYTYSMAGNYNRFPKPAVLGVSGGSSRLLARREVVTDILHNDVDPSDATP